MKILRFSLLQAYFSLNKNKKKALLIINIGIFLSIFAATSAGITYYIEKKINNIEFDLITNQKDLKNSSKNISLFQKAIIDMDLLKRVEDKEFTNLIFIKSLKYGEKIISNKDLYLPYIYLAIKDLVLLEKLFEELGGIIEANKIIVNSVENWDKKDKKKIRKSIKVFELNYNKIQYLKEINDYIYYQIYNQSYDSIIDELKNFKKYTINRGDEDVLYKQYKDIFNLDASMVEYFEAIRKVISSVQKFEKEEIQLLNTELLKFSKIEKRVILFTFFLQLFIFLIIQIFEVSSMNADTNTRRKLR